MADDDAAPAPAEAEAQGKGKGKGKGKGGKGKKRKAQEASAAPSGQVPSLKDLKDRAKKRQKFAEEESVLGKSAPLLEWPYETQLGMKGTYVKSAVRAFTKQAKQRAEDRAEEPPPWTSPEWSLASKAPIGCGCPLEEPIGTPAAHLQGYRNKCEFTIGVTEEGKKEVGFVLKSFGDGRQFVASCEKAPHVPEAMQRLCAEVRKLVEASPFPIFDRRRSERKGVWRLLMARLAPGGQMLVLVQTTTLVDEELQRFKELLVNGLTAAELKVVSVYLQFNDEVTDAARPDAKLLHVHGETHLSMPMLGLNFELGPLSFFQTNSVTCEALYKQALDWLCPQDAIVLDVCCGVGTIGLCASSRCKRVIGLELVPEAVEAAERNAAVNSITNASFRVGRAEEVLPKVVEELGPSCGEVCAVVDPPRPGLHHQVLTALRKCAGLTRIVYVSCNPESLAEDVVRLTAESETEPDPFVPIRAVAVDMFPHTLHCEMVLLMDRASRVPDPRKSAEGRAAEAPLDADPAPAP